MSKKFLNISESKKVLLKNFTSLTALQISNYVFPLITFPYLVRVLGPEKYGLVNFVAAFAGYFTVIVNYGFHLSATREISVVRESREILTEKFWTFLFTKLFLLIVSLPVFISAVYFIPKFSRDYIFYLYAFLTVFGVALFPDWFFQGIEKMKAIAVINIVVKIFWVVSVFLFVRDVSDAQIFVLLNGLSSIVIGFIGISIAIKSFEMKFSFPKFSGIVHTLKSGFYVFLSTVSISLYTTSNVFILGLLAGNEAVGYFAAADKIRNAVQGLFGNAGQTIYPRSAKLFSNEPGKASAFIKKYLKSILLIAIPLTIALFVFSNQIVEIVLGSKYYLSVTTLKIFSFLPLIILLSNIFGVQIMLNTGHNKEFTRIVFLAGLLNIILAIVLIPYFSHNGSALAVLIAEIFVTFSMWRFVVGKGLLKGM